MLGFVLPLAAEEIQLRSSGGTFSVPVRVNNSVMLDFIIDTGASNVVIPADVVSTLLRTGTLTERDFLDRTTYVMADGSKLPSIRFIAREIRIGNQAVRNVVASVSPAKGSPLLGQSFLSRLPSWAIDYRRNALVVNENVPATQTVGIGTPIMTMPVPVAPAVGYGGVGALAYDDSSGHYGLSSNQQDQSWADYAALRSCGLTSCKLIFRTTARQCGAIAVVDEVRGPNPAWGAGKHGNRAQAELAAVTNCQKHTKSQCKIRRVECNR